jgi:NAD(P)-dependent dehydrogenase (short-subunit alcohol dehydrogenase family)
LPAGIYGPKITFDTVTAEDMIQTFTTNAIGPLLVVQQLCRHGFIPPGSLVANVTSKVSLVTLVTGATAIQNNLALFLPLCGTMLSCMCTAVQCEL